MTAFCRRGFQLLSVRFDLIGVNPTPTANPATHPRVAIVGIVPTVKGATAQLQNLGAPGQAATVRATADCNRTRGRVRARQAEGSEAGAAARVPLRLSTYIVREKRRVRAASSAARRSVREFCHRRNSLPSDIGFEAKNGEFAGASWIRRRGRIGVKASFLTDGADRLKLHLVCKRSNRGLRLRGALRNEAAAAFGAADAEARAATRRPRLRIAYVNVDARAGGGPFPGVDAVADTRSRTYWTPGIPVSIPADLLWSGRLFTSRSVAPRGGPEATIATPADVLTELRYAFSRGEIDFESFREMVIAHVQGDIEKLDKFFKVRDKRDISPAGGSKGGGGGGGDKPIPNACKDGKDNDGDGTVDHAGGAGKPKDEACLSPQDTTERHTDWPMEMPGDGNVFIHSITFKPFFGPFGTALPGYALFFNPEMHRASPINHGGQPLSGQPPCALPGTSFEISAGRGAQAPTTSPTSGTPLSPAPDGNHMRIVVEITDAADGQSCSGTTNLRVATDTR